MDAQTRPQVLGKRADAFSTASTRPFRALCKKENVVAQAWKTMDLKLTEEAYRRALKEGVPYAAQIPVKAAV
jgi:hypothetical protein